MSLVLVIENEARYIERIEEALSAEGWRVKTVGDRAAALEAAAHEVPDLVLVDGEVAETDKLLLAFARRSGGPGAVVLVPEDQTQAEAADYGADDLLLKPFSARDLRLVVRRCLASLRRNVPVPEEDERSQFTAAELFGDLLVELEASPEPAPPAPLKPAPPPLAEPRRYDPEAEAEVERLLRDTLGELLPASAPAPRPAASPPAATPATDPTPVPVAPPREVMGEGERPVRVARVEGDGDEAAALRAGVTSVRDLLRRALAEAEDGRRAEGGEELFLPDDALASGEPELVQVGEPSEGLDPARPAEGRAAASPLLEEVGGAPSFEAEHIEVLEPGGARSTAGPWSAAPGEPALVPLGDLTAGEVEDRGRKALLAIIAALLVLALAAFVMLDLRKGAPSGSVEVPDGAPAPVVEGLEEHDLTGGSGAALPPSGAAADASAAAGDAEPPPPREPAGPAEQVAEPGPGVVPPKLVSLDKPGYPADAQRLGVEGTVVLSLLVDEEGRVERMEIVEGVPGDAGLHQAALAAAAAARFEPATRDGAPVKMWYRLTIPFEI